MLAVVMLLLMTFIRVGQPTETCYFAYTDHQLLAFNAEGETRDLLTIIANDNDRPFAWRIDDRTALVHVNDAESYRLYRVSPDEIARIDLPEEINLTDRLRVIGYHGDHLVLTNVSLGPLPNSALLVNLADASADLLTGQVASSVSFSEDGTSLRYMSKDEEDQWTLLERNLTSGEERTLNTVPDQDRFLFFSTDPQGERWLYTTRREDAIVNLLINADGTTENIAEGTLEQPIYWSFFEDMLIGASPLCESDCSLVVREGEDETTYSTPFNGIGITALGQPTPDSLLVLHDGEDVWLLRKEDEPLNFGRFNPQKIFTVPAWTISPDKRYVLTQSLLEPTDFFVWDLTTERAVAHVSVDVGVEVFYFDHGFTVSAYNRPHETILYNDADQSSVSLPNSSGGLYFDLLPDGTLLYWLFDENEAVGKPGIYRYDPANETYTPVVEGASLLYPLPLP